MHRIAHALGIFSNARAMRCCSVGGRGELDGEDFFFFGGEDAVTPLAHLMFLIE